MKDWYNDDAMLVDMRVSEERLAAIGPGDRPELLINALEPCMRVAAGLLMVVKPGRKMSVTHHSLRLPTELLEGWMGTQQDFFEQSLFKAVESDAGDFWTGREGLSEHLRKGLEVLHDAYDGVGLGEGAGMKVEQHLLPGGHEGHVVLALMTHRREQFPRQIEAVSQVLTPALTEAVVRLNLPFTTGRSIHAQVLEDDDVGFVCLNDDGEIVEVNQRAHDLALRYCENVGLGSSAFSMQAFVDAAVEKTRARKIWRLRHADRQGMMQVRAYRMPRGKFELAQDLPMLKLEEWSLTPEEDDDEEFLRSPEFRRLTPRQYEIATLLVNQGRAPKQIASDLDISESTVRKHIENMHKALKVRSLGELIARIRNSRN